ncbi:hypothetical protein ALC57_10099 [Trachymyrmex cornetzi]|uniref:Uncharacterized protein n=1 Tax=Trachymyrmex cornetzi TaxID=471704 RepID=A0A195DXU8_9HYME|nr:hypothetical protein ALC57_10099 [Trachymyrmex cornetzi]
MPRGRPFSYGGMEKKAPAIQRHDTGQTEFLMGRSVIHGSTKSIVYDRSASPWTPSKLSCGVDRSVRYLYQKTIEVTTQSSSENQYSNPAKYHGVPTRCSRRHEKRTLQYDLVFAASAETSNSRRAARQLRSEDELVLLICLTKRFRFFVNTANIGGFWYTRRERLWKKENSFTSYSFLASLGSVLPHRVSSARFPLTTKAVYLVPADEYLIGRISVARYIPPTRLCGGHVVFMRDESAICEIPRIKGERPVLKGR